MAVQNYGLLQYNYSDTNKIVLNSALANTELSLLKYLNANKIPLVTSIPDTSGIYCVKDDKETYYKIYMVYRDDESGIYISEYQYSLQWLNVIVL